MALAGRLCQLMCRAFTHAFNSAGSHIFLITNVEQDMENIRKKEILLICTTKIRHSLILRNVAKALCIQTRINTINHQCITNQKMHYA